MKKIILLFFSFGRAAGINSYLTTLVMVLAMLVLPTALFAQTAYLDEKGSLKTLDESATAITSSMTTWNAGWYVVSEDATISDRITVNGEVHLILADGATLTASKGITVSASANFNVYAQSTDEATMGKLIATAESRYNAGIGGSKGSKAGEITINGGNITAIGYDGAGIGSGYKGTVGTITINDGVIDAKDNYYGAGYGAGIGGGRYGSASVIDIKGGVIQAKGIGMATTSYGNPTCGNINIYDGVKKIIVTSKDDGKGLASSSAVTFYSGSSAVEGDEKDAVFYDVEKGGGREIRSIAKNHLVTIADVAKASVGSVAYAYAGELVTLTLGTAANESSLTVSDGTNNLELTGAGDGKYTFVMPEGDVTVTADVLQTYSISLPTSMKIIGSSIAADGNGTYMTGTKVEFKPSFPYSASNVSDGVNTLTATDGVYSVVVDGSDITITADVQRDEIIDLTRAPGAFAAINGDVLSGSTSYTVHIADGATITLSGAIINGGIVCDGSATIILERENTVKGATNMAGIQVGGEGTTLTIKGNGSLTATGYSQSAGIGLSRAWNLDYDVVGGDVVIEGGNITAQGGSYGAGIGTGILQGSGRKVTLGNITIKGGTVKAIDGKAPNGDKVANGIGTGDAYPGCTNEVGEITIYDDIVVVDASSISKDVTYMHGETDVTDSKEEYFTVNKNDDRMAIAQKLTIGDVEDRTYTGEAFTPKPPVSLGSSVLTEGLDFEYSYENNVNVGNVDDKPTVTVTFKGDYEGLGTVSKTFNITKGTPEVISNPTPNEEGYAGKCLALVNPGTTNFGKLLYRTLEEESFSETIPCVDKTGDYLVYYMVEEGENWEKYVSPEPILVTVELAKFKVTFVDEDGTVLKAAEEYDFGTPAADVVLPSDPEKADDEMYAYTFAGWSPEIQEVTGAATYKPIYNKIRISYEFAFDVNTEDNVFYVNQKVESDSYSLSITDKSKLLFPNGFYRADYCHTGWALTATATTGYDRFDANFVAAVDQYVTDNDAVPSKLYAIWTSGACDHDVTFSVANAAAGSVKLTSINDNKEYVLDAENSLQVPAVAGIQFTVEFTVSEGYIMTDAPLFYISEEEKIEIDGTLDVVESMTAVAINIPATKAKPQVEAISDQVYTGNAITPKPAVTLGSFDIAESADYEYSYTNNVNVGSSATVTVTFKGDYAEFGSVSKSFNITKATPTVIPPTSANPKYAGACVALVTAGSTNFGTMLYSLDDDDDYSENIPCADKGGDYTVYYKVEESDNWFGAAGSVEIQVPVRVDVTVVGDGSVSGYDPDEFYPVGTVLTLTAEPDEDYRFTGWDDDFDAPAERLWTVLADAKDNELTVNFQQKTVCYGAVCVYNDGINEVEATIDGDSNIPWSIPEKIRVQRVNLNRVFARQGYSTIVLPFDFEEIEVDETKFYELDGVSNGSVSVTRVSEVKPNTPYLIRVAKNNVSFSGDITLRPIDEDVDYSVTKNGWELCGTYEYKVWKEGNPELGRVFIFDEAGNLKKIEAGDRVKPLQAYIRYVGTTPLSCSITGIHNFSEEIVNEHTKKSDATCTEKAKYYKSCIVCGTVSSSEDDVFEVGEPLGHSFTEYVSDNNATCEEDGTKTAVCDHGCGSGNTIADEGSKLGHDWGTDGLCHHTGCTDYNEAYDESKMRINDFQTGTDLLLTLEAGVWVCHDPITIEDGIAFNSPVDFVADKVVYSRLANKDTMSIILPFDVPADRLNGVAYKFTSFDGKNLFFESTDGIQANTPCMLSGIKTLGEPIITAELANVTIKASNPIEVEDATGKSAHFGVYEKSLFECGGHDYYGFKNNQFVKAGIDIEVSPFRAAVRLKKSALRSLSYNPATLGIVFDGNEVTHAADIEQTMTGKVNVHDVTGRILRQNVEAANCTDGLEPGVYVVNGKKVVVTVKE